MKDEMRTLGVKSVFHHVDRSSLPAGKKPLRVKWVFTYKYNSDGTLEKCKARLVVMGCFQREGIDFLEVFAPVAQTKSYRILLALAAQLDWQLAQWDVDAAFTNAHISEEIYIYQPEGFDDGTDTVLRLDKALYGLRQAGMAWNRHLNDILTTKVGFRQLVSESCVYLWEGGSERAVMVMHVDDMLIGGTNNTLLNNLFKQISRFFGMKDRGRLSWALGTRVSYPKEGGVTLDQDFYLSSMLERFHMQNARSYSTPMQPNVRLLKSQSPKTDAERAETADVPFKAIVGSLLYAANVSRPDISYAVSQESRFAANPGATHIIATTHTLRYLKATKSKGLHYQQQCDGIAPIAYVDADYGGDPETAIITTGYVVILSGAPVCWQSKLQYVVAQSSAESEYIALAAVCNEVKWLAMFLAELGYPLQKPVQVNIDNQSAKAIAENPVQHQRSKHVNIKFHAVRDYLKQDLVALNWVPSEENIADIFTKPLGSFAFNICSEKLISYVSQLEVDA